VIRKVATVGLLSRGIPLRPSLRRARPVDYGFARRLCFTTMHDLVEQAVGWDEYWMDMNFARQFVLSEVRIITLNDRDIGWIQTQADHGVAIIQHFYIVPEQQGRGIGGTILKQLLAQARRQGKAVTLSVMKRNRARRFYEKHGFRLTHEGTHEIYMRFEPKHSLRGIGPSMGVRRG
jgi:ribosomal protein S18 acetylase RimI-like enzyme